MPDWFFRTVARPILYRLRPATAHAVALGFMGRLARLPLGSRVIDLLGHMRPDRRIAVKVLGIEFASPVGLGPRLDPECIALPAFERFGIGFADVGEPAPAAVARDDLHEDLQFQSNKRAFDVESLRWSAVPKIVRVARLTPELGTTAAILASSCLETPVGETPVLLIVRPDAVDLDSRLEAGLAAGFAGVLIDGATDRNGVLTTGRSVRDSVLDTVKRVRQRFGPAVPIVAGGGVHEVADALALLDAGSNLVEIDTGLVFSGPGLVKRTNEALLFQAVSRESSRAAVAERPQTCTWFWTFLLGIGMFGGGLLALLIAATRVILPYDEAFLGMNREQLRAINPRLISFMAHDRVSLVGPMLTLGLMYIGLSLGAIRRGKHWAMVAVITSASVGFASFFLFLGFGYLDTLHAFVTACLFQLLLLAVHSNLGIDRPAFPPPLHEDRAWRLAQWGQLILVCHAVAILVAGIVISSVGVTAVFVHEDLEFMGTTAESLKAANPRLVPLVAHDRASFGGMLICTGIILLLTTLWGFHAASEWLWWTLLAAGVAGYLPAIVVHIAVGYTDGMHLFPAFTGLGVFLLGVALSRPYLCQSRDALIDAWKQRISQAA